MTYEGKPLDNGQVANLGKYLKNIGDIIQLKAPKFVELL